MHQILDKCEANTVVPTKFEPVVKCWKHRALWVLSTIVQQLQFNGLWVVVVIVVVALVICPVYPLNGVGQITPFLLQFFGLHLATSFDSGQPPP